MNNSSDEIPFCQEGLQLAHRSWPQLLLACLAAKLRPEDSQTAALILLEEYNPV